MRVINSVPIEAFIEKVKIARRKNQRQVILNIEEAETLEESLGVVMTRMAGDFDAILQKLLSSQSDVSVKMDGGSL